MLGPVGFFGVRTGRISTFPAQCQNRRLFSISSLTGCRTNRCETAFWSTILRVFMTSKVFLQPREEHEMDGKQIRVGVSVYGEVGSSRGQGLRDEGLVSIAAYDKYSFDGPFSDLLQS